MSWAKEDPISYFKPQSPEVPVADTTAAKLITQGGIAGVEMFTKMAIAREQARLEHEKMLQEADLTAQKLDLARTAQEQTYDLHKTYYDILKENAGTARIRANTAFTNLLNRNKDAAETQSQIDQLNADVESRAKELKLTDPEFQTKQPEQFAANLLKIRDEFPQAPSYTGIPDKFAQWQTIADQQKIPLKVGATYDAEKEAWVGGRSTSVPIWKVVKGLQDPGEYDMWKEALTASGHIKVDEQQQPIKDERNMWQKIAPQIMGGKAAPEAKTVPKETYDPTAADLFGKAASTDFSRGQNRMPDFVPKTTRSQAIKYGDKIYDPRTTPAGQASPRAVQDASDQLNNEAPLPAEDVEPGALPDTSMAEPTQTDKVLGYARAVIAANPQAKDEVVRRLMGMNIDPNLLSAA